MVNLPSPKNYLKFQLEVLIIYTNSESLRTLTLKEIVNTGFIIVFWKHQVKEELKMSNICFDFFSGGGAALYSMQDRSSSNIKMQITSTVTNFISGFLRSLGFWKHL